MQKAYNRTAWANGVTPINETNLNNIEAGLDEVDNRVITLDTTKATKTEVSTLFSEIAFDEATGILTFTRKNGGTVKIDTKLEKLAINFGYDAENERLVITLDDGTVQYVDMAALITQYEFTESDTIILSVDSAGKVSATIKKGSITGEMLEPNYLANVTVHAENANASASAAAASAASAKSDADRAEDAADKATAIAGFTIDTELSAESANPIANKAVAEALENVDAKTLDGHEAEYFLPKSNGIINGVLDFKRNDEYTGHGRIHQDHNAETDYGLSLRDYNDDGSFVGVRICETDDKVYYRGKDTTNKEMLHTGNMASYVLPLSGGGMVSKDGRSPIELKSTNSNNVTTLYSGTSGTLGELGFIGADNPSFRSTSGVNNTLLHTGNMASHVLLLTGGEIAKASQDPLAIKNTSSASGAYIKYSNADGSLGYFGFNSAGTPIVMPNTWQNSKEILHTGNYTDYAAEVEDGTFTLKLGDVTLGTATYHKVGKIVYCYCTGTIPQEIEAQYYELKGFPFAITSQNGSYFDFHSHSYYIKDGTGNLVFTVSTTAATVAATDGLSSGQQFVFTGIYYTAD